MKTGPAVLLPTRPHTAAQKSRLTAAVTLLDFQALKTFLEEYSQKA